MSPNIVLRNVHDDDLPTFFTYQQEEVALQMAAFTPPNPSDHEAFLGHWQKIRSHDGVTIQTILYNGEVAGHIFCHNWFGDPEVGYWIGQTMWGKGIATAALTQFLRQISTRPLFARVAQDNIGSLRVLQKCGFSITGEESAYAEARKAEILEYILTLSDE